MPERQRFRIACQAGFVDADDDDFIACRNRKVLAQDARGRVEQGGIDPRSHRGNLDQEGENGAGKHPRDFFRPASVERGTRHEVRRSCRSFRN
jgi:hypothetical protein